ncbi:unnamed protein product [Microthlaspi erraticum]|uniref:Uncharacterized protein n=1 Tax=Microthlaspi erraticum TaxID=1685480 RepID=A0A6D2LFL6_9BRAS|nr:unnamed protein product [Microthlaspi erraticum]
MRAASPKVSLLDIPDIMRAQSLKPRLPRPIRDPLPHPKFLFEVPEWITREELEDIKLAAKAVTQNGKKYDRFANLTKGDEYEGAFQRRFEAKQKELEKKGVELTIVDVDEYMCLRFLKPPHPIS